MTDQIKRGRANKTKGTRDKERDYCFRNHLGYHQSGAVWEWWSHPLQEQPHSFYSNKEPRKKRASMRVFHQASGIAANSPGHPVPRLRFMKIPSEPLSGRPRSVRLCSCSQTGMSAACSAGGAGAPCGKWSPSSSIVIGGGGCWGATNGCGGACGSAKGWP